MIVIRDATSSDMPAVRRTYNALIPHTTGTWTEELQTLPQRHAWFRRQTHAGHPVLVAVDAEVVIGFASYGSFRGSGKWPGYRYTVEHTVHVAETHWRRSSNAPEAPTFMSWSEQSTRPTQNRSDFMNGRRLRLAPIRGSPLFASTVADS